MMKIEHLVVDNLCWLRRKAHKYYSDPSDAEDLASETIEKIIAGKDKFDPRKSFRPWALAVMQNTFITQYNRRKCLPFTSMDEDYPFTSPYLADQELAIRNIMEAVSECAARSIAIECVMLYAKGYTYEEISAMLTIPIGTVMSRISNGRRMLRHALGG